VYNIAVTLNIHIHRVFIILKQFYSAVSKFYFTVRLLGITLRAGIAQSV
jgi:hypothetical protein